MEKGTCSACGERPAVTRCAACGRGLCKEHVVHDDPYHSSGLFYAPKDYCASCYKRKQGRGNVLLVLFIMTLLFLFVLLGIFNPF
nr:hypothetical protein [Candidatus Sigynarchaeota archaeon]